jgi:RNA polymerase sigma-70 factor, ECF subfamily
MADSDHDERALVRRLQRGDPRAFDALYARYREPIFAFLLRLARRRESAEDIFQETWLKVARAAPRLRDDTRLRAWLFTIARRTYISHRRWSLLDLSRFASQDLDRYAPEPDAVTTPQQVGLDRALARLPARDREVLLLVSTSGLDQAAAASVLGISHAALRQRLARARDKLSRELAQDDPALLQPRVRRGPS